LGLRALPFLGGILPLPNKAQEAFIPRSFGCMLLHVLRMRTVRILGICRLPIIILSHNSQLINRLISIAPDNR
jgi:hypothetical protein